MAGWGSGSWGGPSFFDPNSTYGGAWAPDEYAGTQAADTYFAQNPEAAWTRLMGKMGLDPSSGQYQFARGLWPQVLEGFKAANVTNPNLRVQDYIQSLNLEQMYNNQTNQQRGENPSKVAPLARTISRGYGGG